MDSSPSHEFCANEKEDNDNSLKSISNQGLDEILAPTSIYNSNETSSGTNLSSFTNDIKFEPDVEFSKNDKHKKKEFKSKKELEEEEREKMQ